MLSLLLSAAIIVQILVAYLAFWLTAHLFKISIRWHHLLVVVSALTLLQLGLAALTTVFDSAAVRVVAALLSMFGGIPIWYILVNRYAAVTFLRATGAFLAGSFVATLSLIIVAIVLASSIQVFTVQGGSMAPAYPENSKVMVKKQSVSTDNGSVVVYKTQDGKTLLGRVKGQPGETVSVSGQPLLVGQDYIDVNSYTLRDNEYYLAPDNAGFISTVVTKGQIIGQVSIVVSK